MPRSFLTEAMWEKLGPLPPPEGGGMGRPRFSNRFMVEAILWKHRTGAPWRDLPEDFGPWTSVEGRDGLHLDDDPAFRSWWARALS